jgi:hypothetical protein
VVTNHHDKAFEDDDDEAFENDYNNYYNNGTDPWPVRIVVTSVGTSLKGMVRRAEAGHSVVVKVTVEGIVQDERHEEEPSCIHLDAVRTG